MERFNFDSIFIGDDKKIQHKAKHFYLGLEALTKEVEKQYTLAVLRGNVEEGTAQRRLAEIEEYEDAKENFLADPRTKAIEERLNQAERVEKAKMISEAITKVLSKQ